MKPSRRRWLRTTAIVLVLLATAGLIVAASGIIPMRASSGHWAITRAFLQFAKNRSIQTQSLTTKVPDLTQPWQVMKGAGLFESGCRPCHGAPDLTTPRIPGAMLPSPPDLVERAASRDPEELFYIVKHGLKFTGMPAWPSPERDDEVWAVVAFLVRLEEYDGDSYRRLVHGNTSATGSVPVLQDLANRVAIPRVVRASCARCHGIDGLGRGNAAFPRLAGQKREYLRLALQAFADSSRHSGIMGPVAAALTLEERDAVASYFSGRPANSESEASGQVASTIAGAAISRGESIARLGIPEKGVPSCQDCHGPGEHRRNDAYPDLAGQYAGYIALQIELFASGKRGGSPYSHLMHYVASRLDAGAALDVAAYYESLAIARNPSRSPRFKP